MLEGIVALPAALRHRPIEIIILPAESSAEKAPPALDTARIEELSWEMGKKPASRDDLYE